MLSSDASFRFWISSGSWISSLSHIRTLLFFCFALVSLFLVASFRSFSFFLLFPAHLCVIAQFLPPFVNVFPCSCLFSCLWFIYFFLYTLLPRSFYWCLLCSLGLADFCVWLLKFCVILYLFSLLPRYQSTRKHKKLLNKK